jgi:hypothetical protein
MSSRPGAGCVLAWCVIAVVVLGHIDATGIGAATVIDILKSGPKIVKEILHMWNELGKIASTLL